MANKNSNCKCWFAHICPSLLCGQAWLLIESFILVWMVNFVAILSKLPCIVWLQSTSPASPYPPNPLIPVFSSTLIFLGHLFISSSLAIKNLCPYVVVFFFNASNVLPFLLTFLPPINLQTFPQRSFPPLYHLVKFSHYMDSEHPSFLSQQIHFYICLNVCLINISTE